MYNGSQSGEEADVGRQRLHRALESLFTFTLFVLPELSKALDGNEYNWWKVFIFLPQELQVWILGSTYPRLAIFFWKSSTFTRTALGKLHQTTLSCFEGWNKFSVLRWWSPWERNSLPLSVLFFGVNSAIADITRVLVIRALCFYISRENLGQAS